MTPQQVEALKLALEFVESINFGSRSASVEQQRKVINAIKEALAQPEQDKLAQDAFDKWWDTQPPLNKTNPCTTDSFEYWAWEGWHAALAQPEQEPVSSDPLPRACNLAGVDYQTFLKIKAYMPVAPPQRTEPVIDKSAAIRIATALGWTPPRTWVGLTDEEIDALHMAVKVRLMGTFDTKDIYRVVEQALKGKNT